MRSKWPRGILSWGKFPVFAYGHGDPEWGGLLQGTLPEPALGDRCRQHPLFHGGRGRSGDLKRGGGGGGGGGGGKTVEDPKGCPYSSTLPQPETVSLH